MSAKKVSKADKPGSSAKKGAVQAGALKLDRRAVVASLIGACPDALVITGLGSSAYDVFAAGDRPENFYLWGAMGGAAAIGLGLALAQPQRSVLVITGDGEQLMGMGALATIAAQQPSNLSVVVLDNGHFAETGMQPSHTSLGTQITDVARACGIADARQVRARQELETLADAINARQGCLFAQVLIAADDVPRVLPPRDGVHLKNRFRAALGFETF
jgi:thiamine pyrophosphate-dependent acetolactate synthase large subunit-like protein